MKTEYLTEPASRTFLVGLGDVGRLAVASVRAERLSRLLVEPSPRSLAEALPLGPTSLLFVTGVGAYRELARLLRSVRRSAGLVVVVLSSTRVGVGELIFLLPCLGVAATSAWLFYRAGAGMTSL